MTGLLGLVASVVGSRYLSPTLLVLGIFWLLFIGEPKRGVLRDRRWSYVGWGFACVLFFCVFATAEAGYIASVIQLPRHLSDIQRQIITNEIKPIANQFPQPVTVQSLLESESVGYCLEIERALVAGGLYLDLQDNVTLLPRTMTGNPPGVFIQVADDRHPPSLAMKLKKVLQDAGIYVFYASNYTYHGDMFALSVGSNAALPLPK
jgi:hypothetical protein